MGTSSQSSVNPQANNLSSLFGASQGYQQSPLASIQAPQYPSALTPSPGQSAQATVQRMLARQGAQGPGQAGGAAPTSNVLLDLLNR